MLKLQGSINNAFLLDKNPMVIFPCLFGFTQSLNTDDLESKYTKPITPYQCVTTGMNLYFSMSFFSDDYSKKSMPWNNHRLRH